MGNDDTCFANEEKKTDEDMHCEIFQKLDDYLSPEQKTRLSALSSNMQSIISNDDDDKPIDLSQTTIQLAFGIDDEECFNNKRSGTNTNIDNLRRRKSSAVIIKREGSLLVKWHDDDDASDIDLDIDLDEGCILIDLNENYDNYSDLD